MQKKSIYIVEDDVDIQDAMRLMLEDCGYKVLLFSRGDFLNKIKKDSLPDLVIVDMLLSGDDGRAICRKLKKTKITKDVPVILMSAHPSAAKEVKGSGADRFISKPFDIQDLLQIIDMELKK